MALSLEKCPRCGKLWAKTEFPVCGACRPAEEAEYDKVRSLLDDNPGLTPQQASEMSEVNIEVIMRMVDSGHVHNGNTDDDHRPIKCGRCGADAISKTKRLCPACLTQLDIETASAMRDMRARLDRPKAAAINSVQRSQIDRRDDPKTSSSGHRMVVRERLDGDRGSRRR